MNTLQKIQGKVGVAADGFWGPKTRAAVAAALGCKANDREIQRRVGVAADGIIGSKSVAGIAAALGVELVTGRVDVFLDIGHTADRAREYPSSFSPEVWQTDCGRGLMAVLGFAPAVHDSFEHILNTAVARAVARHLEGLRVQVFDKPAMGNDAEIAAVYNEANAVRPRVFVSIHHNAQGGERWRTLDGTASGHVCYYVQGRNGGRALAREVSECLDDCRKRYGMPDNRAEHVQAGSYAVIRKLDAGIAATLVEVGFYDNALDVCALVANLDAVGAAIASGIRGSL